MSEFFKALEQAERDRLRADARDASTTPSATRVASSENGVAAERPLAKAPAGRPPADPDVPMETSTTETATTENPTVPVAPVVKPSAPTPAHESPPTTRSSPSAETPPPTRVFRPSLRTSTPERRLGRHADRHHPRLVTLTDPNSIEADAYRTVRANVQLMSDTKVTRHIAITSAAGGDGKSTTAANLAVVAAQAGRRVCLVDADLRRPVLHQIFGLPNVDGLALALEHGKPLHAVAKLTDVDGLSVVVGGRGDHETFQDVLTPERLQSIMPESEAAFDLVIFDSPPVTSVADALSVAAVCDGVILVVRAGSIPFNVLRRAIAQVRQVKGRILGVLLNQVDLRAIDGTSYRHYRSYYHQGRPK